MSRVDIQNDFADVGNTPKATMCLLIIDMINEFRFPDAQHMFPEVDSGIFGRLLFVASSRMA